MDLSSIAVIIYVFVFAIIVTAPRRGMWYVRMRGSAALFVYTVRCSALPSKESLVFQRYKVFCMI